MKQRPSLVSPASILAMVTLTFGTVTSSHAALYWNTTTGTWANTANWWTTDVGTTNPAAPPGSTDAVVFNGIGVNGATIVQLDADAAASGLTFNNTGTTALQNYDTTARTLTLGSGGITVASTAGNVTISTNLSLSANQTWGSAKTITIAGTVSGASRTLNKGNGGTVQFATGSNASLAAITSSGNTDFGLISATGGSLGVSGNIGLGRSNNYSTAPTLATPVSAVTSSGLYINGAAVSAGSLSIGLANSSTSVRVDSGSLAVSGKIMVANHNNSGRWSILQVNDGTFTSSDATDGIVISPNRGTYTNNGEVYFSGGVSTAEKIAFGASTDTKGGNGFLILGGGTLYLGTGGIVKASTTSGADLYNYTVGLNSGTLGAKDNWSSSLNMTLGANPTIKAADISNVAKDITLSGNLSGTAFTKTGAGTLTLSGANGFTGGVTISEGFLKIGSVGALNSAPGSENAITFGAGSTGSLNVNGQSIVISNLTSNATVGTPVVQNANAVNGTLTVGNAANLSGTYGGVIQDGTGGGTLALTKAGGGTLTLTSSNNTYSGGTTIQGGELKLEKVATSVLATAGSGAVTFQGGTLRLIGGNNDYMSFGNNLIVAAGQTGNLILPGRIGVSGSLTGASDTTLNVTVNWVRDDVSGDWSGFYGQLNLNGGGQFRLNSAKGLPNAKVNTGAAATMLHSYNGNATQNIGELSGAAGSSLSIDASGKSVTWSVGGLNTDSTFSGAIVNGNGTASLSKTGSGVLTLQGDNTYTGATTVSKGTLVINGNQSTATGNVGVSGAGTRLKGSGTIGGDTTLNVGAIHSPGNSVGTQTFHDGTATTLTYAQGSIFEWELGASLKDSDTAGAARGTDWDAVNVSGTLGTTGTGAIFRVVLDGSTTFADAFWLQDREWTDIFKTSDLGSAVNFQSVFSGFQHYNYSGAGGSLADLGDPAAYGSFSINGSTLTWTAVPEPTSALAGLMLAAGLLRRRR